MTSTSSITSRQRTGLRAALAAGALVVAACGSDATSDDADTATDTDTATATSGDEATDTASAVAKTVPDETVPDGTVPSETVPDETVPDETVPSLPPTPDDGPDADSDTGDGEDGDADLDDVDDVGDVDDSVVSMRSVDHVSGTTEIPAEPQRIYTNSFVVVSHLTSVGITPVAVPEGIDDYLRPYDEAGLLPDVDLDSLEFVGTSIEPNLEALVTYEPDLIIIEDWAADEGYEILSEIAPTVTVSRPTNADWQSAFDQTMDFASVGQPADEIRQRYADLLATVPDAAADTSVAFFRGFQSGTFRIDGLTGFAGSVGAEGGYQLDVGGGTASPDDSFIVFSNEELGSITADVIVTT
ncbi:MAG: ABC transporter substrate-binding protein, partial [Actinomycetota bacterium]